MTEPIEKVSQIVLGSRLTILHRKPLIQAPKEVQCSKQHYNLV